MLTAHAVTYIMARKLCHLRAVWIFNIHWLDNTDQSLVIVDGGNRGTMKKNRKRSELIYSKQKLQTVNGGNQLLTPY